MTEQDQFMQKVSDKIRDGEIIYKSLALDIAKWFRIDMDYGANDIVYIILNHYIDNVDENLDEWLHKDDAPFVRDADELPKIFPEIAIITKDYSEIVEIANSLYGLNLELYKEWGESQVYVYSFSFSFNSFKPIKAEDINDLLSEYRALKKYGIDTTDVEAQLSDLGLNHDFLRKYFTKIIK